MWHFSREVWCPTVAVGERIGESRLRRRAGAIGGLAPALTIAGSVPVAGPIDAGVSTHFDHGVITV